MFFNCSVGYDITERIGGDITGFSNTPYSARFYSSESNDMVVQTMYDTILENQNYKEIYFNNTLTHLLYSEHYIYQRYEFNGTIIVSPFLNKVIIEGMKDFKNSENSLYSYKYIFNVDSLRSVKINDSIYNNCYFVKTSTNLTVEEEDTSFSNIYILTYEEGIIGIYSDSAFMLLDSIVTD
ncbi:MAG: hypothetical protein COX48_05365 [bacterium (Candidatus Stahlbacteria) CG23_combo_of_CG06-09_8_20_14_all_34_7]|nr:MAG: hypothetical protein COX48_05365 [bacterium (Candidatus Stahlbacteria) CG23_combo_of_CG06-09_8_20_14_all_34_7]